MEIFAFKNFSLLIMEVGLFTGTCGFSKKGLIDLFDVFCEKEFVGDLRF